MRRIYIYIVHIQRVQYKMPHEKKKIEMEKRTLAVSRPFATLQRRQQKCYVLCIISDIPPRNEYGRVLYVHKLMQWV